jgi:hypothetical protein
LVREKAGQALKMALPFYDKTKKALQFWLAHRLPTCKALAPVMSQSLERRLAPRERVVLWAHLLVCVWCRWYLKHLRFLRNANRERAARVSESGPPAGAALSPGARERIERALSASPDRNPANKRE